MSAAHDFLDHVGIGLRHLSDVEERCLGAELVERVENGLGVLRHRAVVEGQHDLLGTEKAILLLVFGEGAVQWAGLGVDLDDARYAERALRIGARLLGPYRREVRSTGGDQRNGSEEAADHNSPRLAGRPILNQKNPRPLMA